MYPNRPLLPYVHNKQGIDLGLHRYTYIEPKGMRDKAQKEQKKIDITYSASDGDKFFFLFTSQMIPMNGIPFEKYKYPKASRYSL